MAITIDEAFEQIGSMGCYQIRLLAIFVFCAFSVVGFQALLITFIAAEPGWKCADNSTACNLTGVHRPASKHYNFRCDLDRSDWEFTDDYTSAVTQVSWVACVEYSLFELPAILKFISLKPKVKIERKEIERSSHTQGKPVSFHVVFHILLLFSPVIL